MSTSKAPFWAQYIEQAQAKLDTMQPRERLMLLVMVVFLVCTSIGFSLWKVNQLAQQEQQRLNELKAQISYMQNQVVSMKPAGELELSLMEKVQRVSQQLGLSVQSVERDGEGKIEIIHQNYAVIANFMMQLSQMGVSFDQYELASQGQQIKLTATVH